MALSAVVLTRSTRGMAKSREVTVSSGAPVEPRAEGSLVSNAGRARGFWWTNHVANPVLRRLLCGPLGSRLGRHLAVLRYRGRSTGRAHELVVQYAQDGHQIWVMPGHPERKRWWRNL